jgi:hypothetical protein
MPSAPAEIHVPISPTPGFFTRVRLLAATLRRYGGALAGAPVVVTVSRDCEPYDIAAAQPWSRELGVQWRWADPVAFARHGMYATALSRMTYAFEAPFVLLLDADTIVTGPLDELIELGEHDAIGGVVAHLPPAVSFHDGRERRGQPLWDELHRRAGLVPPPLRCEHTAPSGVAADERRCPAYFNLGALAASAATMTRLGATIFEELEAVNRFGDSWFRCQLALTLAIARTGCAWSDLPVRWNFPNDDDFWRAYGEDRDDVRVLHYLRGGALDRERDTGSPEGLAALLGRRDLSPVHALLRDRVAGVADRVGVHA